MISGHGRWSRAQMAVVGAVVAVVVGLFAFMALNSGPDGSSEEVDASGSTPAAPASTTTTDASDDAPLPTAAPMPVADPGADPASQPPDDPAVIGDSQRFCDGALGITPLERDLSGAMAAEDLEAVRRAVAEHRDAWTTAVTDLIEAGPEQHRVAFERYRDVYLWVFGLVDTDGDLARIGKGYPPEYRDRYANDADPINVAVRENCG